MQPILLEGRIKIQASINQSSLCDVAVMSHSGQYTLGLVLGEMTLLHLA